MNGLNTFVHKIIMIITAIVIIIINTVIITILLIVSNLLPYIDTNLSSGVRAKYSLSMRLSILFLISIGDGRKRDFS